MASISHQLEHVLDQAKAIEQAVRDDRLNLAVPVSTRRDEPVLRLSENAKSVDYIISMDH